MQILSKIKENQIQECPSNWKIHLSGLISYNNLQRPRTRKLLHACCPTATHNNQYTSPTPPLTKKFNKPQYIIHFTTSIL